MLQTINGTLRQTNLPNESEEYLSKRFCDRLITRIPVIHGCRAISKNAASTSWYWSTTPVPNTVDVTPWSGRRTTPD